MRSQPHSTTAPKKAARIYEAYERALHKAGALDFDDLLLRAVEVLRRFDDARASWQQRFRFVHVDEYQDTNRVQYELLRLVTGPNTSLCVVGDEDQSIYRWRGADVGNILRFTEDFPGAKVLAHRAELPLASKYPGRGRGRRCEKHPAHRQAPGSYPWSRHRICCIYEARDARAESEYVAGRVAQIAFDDSTCAHRRAVSHQRAIAFV